MCIVAASTAAAVGGSLISADASRRAANTAADAQRAGLAQQNALFQQTAQQAQPYIGGGRGAYEALLKSYGLDLQGNATTPDYGGFYNAPDYKFALEQGQQQLDRQAAAKGNLYSGQQIKAGQKFGEGLATQYLGNYRTGLQNASNTGVNAVNALAGQRQAYGQQVGQGYQNLGDIGAAGALGRGQAFTNALGGAAYSLGHGGGGPSNFGGGVTSTSIPSVSGTGNWYRPPGSY